MNPRERLAAVLNHQQPDRVVLDLGSNGQTGINATTLYKFRAALGLEQRPIKIIEPFQMLGEVEEDLLELLGVDVSGVWNLGNMLGFANKDWKPFTMDDGTPVLMAGGFEYDRNEFGDTLVFPAGDRTAPHSAKMPKGGSFFDSIERSPAYDEDKLTPRIDFADDFAVASDQDAFHWETQSKLLFEETNRALIGNLGGFGLGDVASIPGPALRAPKGIRKIEDWLMAHILYPEYIEEVFSYQTEIMLKNLEIYKQAVGDRIQVIWVSGTDFGTQNALFSSVESFRTQYKPFYKKVNDWIHKNTNWKTFYHSCGAVAPLIDDMVDMGVDCLNPVQLSAVGMDAQVLKDKYGDKLVFWGGGVDTQSVLPFGTPEEVRKQVSDRIQIMSKGGGYVFATIHNIVANVPPENLIAIYETVLNKKLV